MRLFSVRLIVSLILGITLVSLTFSYYQVVGEKRALRGDLERRADVLGESLAGNVEKAWGTGSDQALQRLVQRFGNREHLIGVAVYDRQAGLVAITPGLTKTLTASPLVLSQAIQEDDDERSFIKLGSTPVLISALPIHRQDELVGGLVLVHDTSYIHVEMLRLWRETFLRALAQVVLIVFITLLIVRWSISGPIARAAQWMRAQRTGKSSSSLDMPYLDTPQGVRAYTLEPVRPVCPPGAVGAVGLRHRRIRALVGSMSHLNIELARPAPHGVYRPPRSSAAGSPGRFLR